MRKIAYFFAGCIIIGLIIAAILQNFPVFGVIGRGMLLSISHEQYDQAYEMFSPDFKSRNSLQDFKTKIIQLGLNQYESVEWTSEKISEDKAYATIVGTMTTKAGQQLYVELQFVKSATLGVADKAWRIDAMYVRPAGAALPAAQPQSQPPPP